MKTVRGPVPPPDVKLHRHDRAYLLSLLERAKLSQREAAKLLGEDERTMRSYCSGEQETPYLVQYALEALAALGVDSVTPSVREGDPDTGHRSASATIWFDVKLRPVNADDAGKILVAVDQRGSLVAGEVTADAFGLGIASSFGIGARRLAVNAIARYALVDPPIKVDVSPTGADAVVTPPDYVNPAWDDAGNPSSWKYYLRDIDMVSWLDKPEAERERLAREALLKLSGQENDLS